MSIFVLGALGLISYYYTKNVNLTSITKGIPAEPINNNNEQQFEQRKLNKHYKSGAVMGLTQQLNMTPYLTAVQEHALKNIADYNIPINPQLQAIRIHKIYNLEEDPRIDPNNRYNKNARGFRYMSA